MKLPPRKTTDLDPAVTRREALRAALFGIGTLGLRAVATGLPISFLLNPRLARAAPSCLEPQFLILSISANGDALNCNVPGTYDVPGFDALSMYHGDDRSTAGDVRMARQAVALGATSYTAAAPWGALSAAVRNRLTFFHHRTSTANHGELNKVLALFGALRRGEQAPAFYAKNLAGCFTTVQQQPIALGGETISFQGRYLPNLSPTGLAAELKKPTGVPLDLQTLRDSTLDQINEVLKQNRAKTTAERDFVDKLALSQTQLRTMMDNVGGALANIKDNSATSQGITAALLVKFNITPVVTIHLPFSGDNHTDVGWNNEATQTVASVASINSLMDQLKTFGLSDSVTFATLNVFGRQFNTFDGRGHNPAHSVSVLVGKHIKPGVIGGLMPDAAKNGVSTGIDSVSGAAAQTGGDISAVDTLPSLVKTLGVALGIPQATVDDQITTGKVVTAAIA
jgi:hypothetical protein